MNIKSIDEGIRALLKLGYDNPRYHNYGASIIKSKGGSHTIVNIEDQNQTVTFNGLPFEQWKEEQND